MTAHTAYPIQYHSHDVLVVGAGGAGLRAAVAAAQKGVRVGVITKVPPTRSHTVAAQGGINAALGNVTPDDWRWHMYDTIRGSDWLGDQDAIAFMCREAASAIRDLDAMGVAFSRDDKGNIYQRAYGGMSTHFGKGEMAFRACAAADQTGDAIMRGLYRYACQYPIDFFVEYIALDLLHTQDGACRGVIAWELATGALHVFLSPHTILATGGYGQVYASSTSSSTCTGDGNAMVLRAGLALQDMEYVQFHPTGIHGVGILISEATRSEGGFLKNANGERFMERYAPKYRELASRDVVTRAIISEIAAGRGCGADKGAVHLDLTHIPLEILNTRLPGTQMLAKHFAKVDVTRDPIPVYPTAHYTMGGIPANRECAVLHASGVVEGLYAIGEAACNSVHGANRLGCNSLLDLIVFGKHAGEEAAKEAVLAPAVLNAKDTPHAALEAALVRFDALRHAKGQLHGLQLRRHIGQVMQDAAGILREREGMQKGLAVLSSLMRHYHDTLRVADKDLRWNNGLVAAIESANLLMQGVATLACANFRTESRGAHYRTDFPHRDDDHWLAHTRVVVREDGSTWCDTAPVRFNPEMADAPSIPPEMRAY